MPEHASTRYAILTDKESTTTAVSLSDLRPARNQGSIGGYRDILKDQLFSADARRSARRGRPGRAAPVPARRRRPRPVSGAEDARRSDAAGHGAERRRRPRTRRAGERVETRHHFGFTATELDRAKQASLAASERAAEESPDRESSSRADEYTRNFLQREALPTIWQELAFHRRFLPEITLNEMNALATDWFPAANRLVVASTPDVAGRVPPTESQLAAAVETASARAVTAYVDEGAGQALHGTSAGEREHRQDRPQGRCDRMDAVERRHGGAPAHDVEGGSDSVPGHGARWNVARERCRFLPGTGRRRCHPRGWNRHVLASGDRQAGEREIRSPSSRSSARSARACAAAAPPRDLEAMFQLIYLRFTAPRADPTAFAAMKASALAMLADQSASPDVLFNQTLVSALSGNNPRRQPETSATVAKWNLDTSLAFYKARFADASNFTFVFVGSFTLEAMRPLIETYIASLARDSRARDVARPRHQTARRRRPDDGAKGDRAEERGGDRVQRTVRVHAAGPLALQTATLLLQGRLSDTIREQLGATYAISAESETSRYPRPEYRITIHWTCDPAQVESLVPRVLQEVAAVRDTPLTDNQMTRIRNYLQRELDRSSQDNAYLLDQILRRYETGESLNRDVVSEQTAEIMALTSGAVTAPPSGTSIPLATSE